ncbi:MAG: 7-cyano-7-deazaguanine synthase QueC [Candidatus Aminicenantaceae bacterium]
MKECIVLFSGGIDSTTVLYWSLNHFEKVHALTFDYSQRHSLEIRLARRIARNLNVFHTILHINLNQMEGSSLIDSKLPLPQYKNLKELESGPPSTYVPFRNGIFLALAAAWAEPKGIKAIACGFNTIDSPHYPDTREEFVKAMEEAINLGTKAYFTHENIKIIAPFVDFKKSEIIKEGLSLGADYSYSISCYAGKEIPCTKCASCLIRRKAWREAGKKDPLLKRLKKEGKI